MQTILAGIITVLTQLCAGFVMPAAPATALPHGVIVAHHSFSSSWSASAGANDAPPTRIVTTPATGPVRVNPPAGTGASSQSHEVHLVPLVEGIWAANDNSSLFIVGVDGATARNYAALNSDWVTNHAAHRIAVIGWDDGCNGGTQVLVIGSNGVITGGPSTSSKVGCGSAANYDASQRLHALLAGPSTVTLTKDKTLILTSNSSGDTMEFHHVARGADA